MKFPKSKIFTNPFLSTNDIDKKPSVISIGDKFSYDTGNFNNSPDIIKTVCEIIPHNNFSRPIMTLNYRNEPDKILQKNFDIYAKTTNFISSLDIIFKSATSNIPNLPIDSTIYKREFKIQTKSRTLKPFEKLMGSVIITTTAAFAYGAKYTSDISMKDIQSHLFYIRNEYTPSFKIISAKDFLSQNEINLARELNVTDLASLDDDITDGKIIFNLPTGEEYKSIASEKTTLTNNLVFLYFKK